MRTKKIKPNFIYVLVVLLFLNMAVFLTAGEAAEQAKDTALYLGQTPPGAEPQVFGAGIIANGMAIRDMAISPCGKELYYTLYIGQYTVAAIMFTRFENGKWTRPEVAPFSTDPTYKNLEPAFSPDGKRLYYFSTRPPQGKEPAPSFGVYDDIWYVERTDKGWSEPVNIGAPINTENSEFFPSLTKDGTMYFTRMKQGERKNAIYRSRLVNGVYAEPELLPAQVNCGMSQYNASIAPDESYIIVCVAGKKENLGMADYYICFRTPDDKWSEPINLGEPVNNPEAMALAASASPDGKYFFFTSGRFNKKLVAPGTKLSYDLLKKIATDPENGNNTVYWMDAGFIEKLKPR